MAHIIKALISWAEKNYSGGWGFEGVGVILCTDKTLDGIKKAFKEALEFHVESMIEDGDEVPEWLASKDYEIEYVLDSAAMLRQAEEYTTLAAISRVTGIHQKLLSHYANGLKKPRPAQRQRIIDGLHQIGRQLSAVH